MNQKIGKLQDYVERTRSAAKKIFEAIHTYNELLTTPARPSFVHWGDETPEVQQEYEVWREKNKEEIAERLRRDEEFVAEQFALAVLSGTILQFVFMGIKQYSQNESIPMKVSSIPQINIAKKFCVGRDIDGMPSGLIIYAGRNQANHYGEKERLREPSRSVFDRLRDTNVSEHYDLNNPRLTNYSTNILYKLGWHRYADYERDMLEILAHQVAGE